jgi:hypothetical protein
VALASASIRVRKRIGRTSLEKLKRRKECRARIVQEILEGMTLKRLVI